MNFTFNLVEKLMVDSAHEAQSLHPRCASRLSIPRPITEIPAKRGLSSPNSQRRPSDRGSYRNWRHRLHSSVGGKDARGELEKCGLRTRTTKPCSRFESRRHWHSG